MDDHADNLRKWAATFKDTSCSPQLLAAADALEAKDAEIERLNMAFRALDEKD